MTLSDFDAIRPYQSEELPAAFDSLVADSTFCGIMQQFFKDVPFEVLKKQMYACKDSLEVQKTFFYPLIKNLLKKCCTGCTMNSEAVPDKNGTHTFISNHRDIVLDPALLDILLIDEGFRTTVEIAIGDNLLIHPWIKTLVRINKSFIVQRSVTMREMLACSKCMSEYMHFALKEKLENIWIAQREGRAKDSNDRTQESVLKMMAMGGEGSAADRLKAMHLVPLAISYEYDPCDFLKAKEFQQKRDNADFKKSREDDLMNMQTGIFGYKGEVHYALAPKLDDFIDKIATLPKAEFFSTLAARIDYEIHLRYRLFPGNYVAADLLEGGNRFAKSYNAKQKATFEKYLAGQLAHIELPGKDETYLRERIIKMYANPLLNQLAAKKAATNTAE